MIEREPASSSAASAEHAGGGRDQVAVALAQRLAYRVALAASGAARPVGSMPQCAAAHARRRRRSCRAAAARGVAGQEALPGQHGVAAFGAAEAVRRPRPARRCRCGTVAAPSCGSCHLGRHGRCALATAYPSPHAADRSSPRGRRAASRPGQLSGRPSFSAPPPSAGPAVGSTYVRLGRRSASAWSGSGRRPRRRCARAVTLTRTGSMMPASSMSTKLAAAGVEPDAARRRRDARHHRAGVEAAIGRRCRRAAAPGPPAAAPRPRRALPAELSHHGVELRRDLQQRGAAAGDDALLAPPRGSR